MKTEQCSHLTEKNEASQPQAQAVDGAPRAPGQSHDGAGTADIVKGCAMLTAVRSRTHERL